MPSTISAEPPRVLDASVLINLLAVEPSLAREILRARAAPLIVTKRVIEREVLENPRDRSLPARPRFDGLAADDLIRVVPLDDQALTRFVDLAMEVGDGEAATIACAESTSGIAVLDDGPARRLDGIAHLEIEWSTDILMHGSVIDRLGHEVVANAVFDALRFGRMRVPRAALNGVIQLVGPDRAGCCPSLPRRALEEFMRAGE